MFTRLLLLCILVVPSQAATLVSTDSTWRFLRGTTEASSPDRTAWRSAAFNDASFADAPAPFWYGDVRPGGTQLADMINAYSCIFLRKTVSVVDAAQIGGLRLNYFIDDGFIVWVNGTEVYRENVTGDPTFATLAANQATDPAPLVSVTVFPSAGVLQEGDNIITIQVFNTTAGSSDLGFDCSIESLVSETVPPTMVSFIPSAGSRTDLTQITVTFSEPVTGVDADDLAIAGNPATGVTGNGATYTFTFAQPIFGPVPITWETSHGITDLAAPPNAFDAIAPGATWSYTLVDVVPPAIADRFPQPGVTVSALRQVEVTFSETVTGVDAADLRVNGQPATNVIAQPNSVHVFQFPQPAEGLVSITFVAGHGITDLAAVPNVFAGSSWSCTLNSSAVAGDLVITEINAANQSGLRDEDGEEQDWIEIYNRGSHPANLAGWSLSDDDELPGQWIFPSKVLLPNQYLVVFASGKDRKAPSGANRFHANFTLANDGEFIGLFNSDSPRLLISGFGAKYPVQRNDYSYGPESGGNLRYFAIPTPGAVNGASTTTGVVEPVHFSSARGHYTQPFDLILSCPTPGATIRFTKDGSEPTEMNGSLYVGSLRVTNTTLLRAAAFRTSLLVSKVTTHSFFFGLTAADRSLPTLSILTHSNNLLGRTGIIGMSGGTGPPNNAWTATTTNDYFNPTKKGIEWEKPASVEYIDPVDNSGFQVDAGLRVQGSDWTRPRYTATSKFSYRLYFRGDYGSGRLEFPLMPTGVVNSFDQIVLRAGHNDETNPYITDELMRQIFADQGQVSVHGTFVNFWLNGVLKRYYNPTERVEEGFLQSWHGGGKNWDIITVGSVAQGGDNVAWNSLRTYVSGQNVLLPSVYQEIERRMDLTNFIDYLIVNTYAATWDWPHNNWRAARERATAGRFRFYVWDAEGAFGFTRSTPTFDSFSTTDSGLLPPGTAEIPRLYQGLRVSPEFRLLWADRVQKHFFNKGALTDTNLTERFLQLRAKVLPVISGFDNKYLTTWIPQRRAPLLTQYVTYGLMASSNAPVFSRHGGLVPAGFNLTITNPTGTIYYTLDGSDPRVKFSGAVSNSAIAYTSPIALHQNILIRARARSGTNWSAVSEATFEVGTQGSPLRITEINYNPPGGSVHEFIELQNISGAPVDLSGSYFDEGITFTFKAGSSLGAGARLVLANNTDTNSFAGRYPGVPVAGYFSGNLANSGERLTLRTAAGIILLTVDYRDSGGWPTAADGAGSTLELLSPYGDPDDPANWFASSQTGGTPGTASNPPPAPVVRLNEVLADNGGAWNHEGTFPDYIEIRNTGASPVNIGGWSITDDGNARKFVFPSGNIPAGSYALVLCDDATNTTLVLHTGFALQRNGDSVFLYDASTNLVDALTFGLQVSGRSVGRIGGEWALNTPTPSADNTAASVAPASSLSINEWMANPLAGQPDWIELYNTSALPVSLKGCYLGTTNVIHRISSLSFVGGNGFIQLFADEAVGADHLDFKLPAATAPIVLYGPAGEEVNRVSYTNALEGITRGRLPDGAANLVNFAGSASPGASNYVNIYTGPVFHEIFARNQTFMLNGRVADYVELFNSSGSAYPLFGMSMSVNAAEPGQFAFPLNASVPANGYLVIWCDGARPLSLTAGDLNTGRSLDGESGGAYLFNAQAQLVSTVEYGFQANDLPIGLSGAQWRLLSGATPGAANAPAAALGTNRMLRLNEWMANPSGEPDWFEIFNRTNLPVELSGLTLTDDPTSLGLGQFRIAPLSFIGPMGFVKCVADGNAGDGRNHVNFSLNDAGEFLGLYSNPVTTNFILIDAISFEAQALGISEGRLPDGKPSVSRFPGSSTPGESNYRQLPNVVINEILAHADGSTSIFGNPQTFEDAVELSNPSASPAIIGGWYLSNSQDDFKKFRIADGTVIPAGGIVVLHESQFGNATQGSLAFSADLGGEVWLSEADPTGNLTGFRTGAKFGASEHGVSSGRIVTSVGTDYSALSANTLGTANAAPKVGPIMISEIMYNPVAGAEEYIELYNASTNGFRIELMDYDYSQPPPRTNTWRISGGIEFVFPIVVSMGSGQRLLVVGFNPNDASALAAFRARYNVPESTAIFGPFSGKLDNAGESISLLKPKRILQTGAASAGETPYIRVDRVDYTDAAPWPSGEVDGGGLSLQRKSGSLYGNEPMNWVADAPTPGQANGAGIVAPPSITRSPADRSVFEGESIAIDVAAGGASPLGFQWRFNGISLPEATNSFLSFSYVLIEDAGSYDCIVSNPGGSSVTAAARLSVVAAPRMIIPLTSLTNRTGSNAVFSAVVRGSAPLSYQWRLNGSTLPGETNATISRNGILIADDGEYDVLVSNPFATLLSSARLVVLSNTVITLPPTLNLSAVTSSFFTVSVAAMGNPLPFSYDWRRGAVPVASNEVNSRVGFVTLQAPTNITPSQSYRVIVRNLANPGTSANFQFFLATLADSDVDGLPDIWEIAYGLDSTNQVDAIADADGDGISNYQEYLAGTDPTNALSRLTAQIGTSSTSADVSFQALSNKTYSLQYRENFNGGSWSTLADVYARPSNRVEVINDPASATNRFYRVVTPRQP